MEYVELSRMFCEVLKNKTVDSNGNGAGLACEVSAGNKVSIRYITSYFELGIPSSCQFE